MRHAEKGSAMIELMIVALMLAFGLGLMLQWWQTIWQAQGHRLARATQVQQHVGQTVCLEMRNQAPDQNIVNGQQLEDYTGRWHVGYWQQSYRYQQHLRFVQEAICND